jgi:hypothetical protein
VRSFGDFVSDHSLDFLYGRYLEAVLRSGWNKALEFVIIGDMRVLVFHPRLHLTSTNPADLGRNIETDSKRRSILFNQTRYQGSGLNGAAAVRV